MMYATTHTAHAICFLFFTLAFSALLPPQENCGTCLPNPLAEIYPYNVTGIINATTAVLLVPLPYAQSLLPSRFSNATLNHAYTRFNIPPSLYPIIIEAAIDHDIRFNKSTALADFSSLKVTFPFIDLLGDGYSNFRYTSYIYLSPSIPQATHGTEAYGITTRPAFFDPPDAPYRSTHVYNKDEMIFAVYTLASSSSAPRRYTHQSVASFRFHDTPSISPFPLSFYKNVTNQPLFGNNSNLCDNMVSFWNTTISVSPNSPLGVVGGIMVPPAVLPRRKRLYRSVRGIRAQRAFLENNYRDCKELKGYGGTGDGDSG